MIDMALAWGTYLAMSVWSPGVFDGVGGWQRQGIDPSAYSQSLARVAESVCLMGMNSQVAMQKAWEATKAKGSSTACIVTVGHLPLIAMSEDDSIAILVGKLFLKKKRGGGVWGLRCLFYSSRRTGSLKYRI